MEIQRDETNAEADAAEDKSLQSIEGMEVVDVSDMEPIQSSESRCQNFAQLIKEEYQSAGQVNM